MNFWQKSGRMWKPYSRRTSWSASIEIELSHSRERRRDDGGGGSRKAGVGDPAVGHEPEPDNQSAGAGLWRGGAHRVRLTPESGDAITVEAWIDNTVNNPATVGVPVTLPVNTGVNVMVYTR